MPFLRSQTRASSISPLELVRAFLQSIMGAPLRSRSSFTWAAVMFVVLVLIFLFLLAALPFTTFDPRGSWPDAGHKIQIQNCLGRLITLLLDQRRDRGPRHARVSRGGVGSRLARRAALRAEAMSADARCPKC